MTEAVGFYEYVRDVEQDFVKKIELEDSKVEMLEFLSKGMHVTACIALKPSSMQTRLRNHF